MSAEALNNVNVAAQELLTTPAELKERLPASGAAAETVRAGRETIRRILDREDPRLLVIAGPCSVHDVGAARDYAERLRGLADEVGDSLALVMRVYFEKPRTTVGWKGMINDPRMDDSFDIEEGLSRARQLLLDLAELGLPTGTEALDPIVPQYLGDLVAWSAIGARTTESQTHREMASGLSTPVGFKNGTDGSLDVAVNALHSVSSPHSFLGINHDGRCAVIRTGGNAYGHIVLRGGSAPNYDAVNIGLCERTLGEAGLEANIVVDCSHGNSNKDPAVQEMVADNLADQIVEGNRSIIGMMLESHINWGKQKIPPDLSQLQYGVSVTDPCMDWETTERLLRRIAGKVRDALPGRPGRRPASDTAAGG